jgi:hypothetical protein
MTMTATYHDVEPYAVEHSGMASARCLTHQTATAEQWPTMSQAARDFRCDEGRNLRFITEFSGEDLDLIPVMRDLSGLARTIRGDAEAHAQMQDHGHTSAWLWLGDGRVEPLEITLDHMSEFDLNDYASQTWKVSGADGRVIVSVRVRIDGRA